MTGSRVLHVLAVLVTMGLIGCDATVQPVTPTPPLVSPAESTSVPTSPPVVSAAPSNSPPIGEAAWLPAGDLVLGRAQTNLAHLGGNKVLVVGNDNVCSPGAAWEDSVRAELGDPLALEWKQTASLRSPRDRFVLAALPDGRALVTGGTSAEDEVGPRSYSSTYLFDAESGSWSRSGLLYTARSDPAGAVLADGRVIVAGGYYSDLPADPRRRTLNGTEIFDRTTGEWTRTAAATANRYGAAAVTLADGRVLMVGGWPFVEGEAPALGQPLPVSSAEVYDPATGRWQLNDGPELARSEFVLVALPDGGALIAGGRVYIDAGDFGYMREPTASAERFNPTPRGGFWTPTADMSVAAADRTGVVLANGQVLVAGGDVSVDEADLDVTPPGLTADAELYDPVAGAWTGTLPMPRPRSGASAVILEDGSALLAGGIMAFADRLATPACPVPDPQALRYVLDHENAPRAAVSRRDPPNGEHARRCLISYRPRSPRPATSSSAAAKEKAEYSAIVTWDWRPFGRTGACATRGPSSAGSPARRLTRG